MNHKLKKNISNILKEAGLSSEIEALRNQAWMISLAKVQKYQTELTYYQKKYQMLFDDFEKKSTADQQRRF
jgi:hypothetical protein